MFGLAFALGRRELLELFFAHRFIHLARCALKLADLGLAALGGERRARRLLLSLGFAGIVSPSLAPFPFTAANACRPRQFSGRAKIAGSRETCRAPLATDVRPLI